jgi:hypothetical protein
MAGGAERYPWEVNALGTSPHCCAKQGSEARSGVLEICEDYPKQSVLNLRYQQEILRLRT